VDQYERLQQAAHVSRSDWTKVEDWDVEDPFGADPSVYQEIFEDIRTRIEALIARLSEERP
jgi:protein-tyrosine-phosphatase